MGVEPGLSDVFARYAQDHLFSEIDECGVRDGANLVVDGYDFAPSFSIWTTIEECLNPPAIWERDRGWFTTPPFSEPETFDFPDGIGPVECVNVEHEEVLLIPRWVKANRVTFKYGLGDEFIGVLKTLHKLGLDRTAKVRVGGAEVSPRDVVAALLPDPATLGDGDGKGRFTQHAAAVDDPEPDPRNARRRRHLERHVVDIKKFEIRSPMDGLAVMQSIWRGSDMNQIQEGDRVSPGQPFMKVVNQNSMQVDASMNQAEVGDFKVGLPAEIGLDAFPGLTFKGKIYSIGALAAGGWRSSFYIRNVPVRFAIMGSDPRLIPDLSAYGNVEIERQDDALLAPLGTIRTKGDKSYVAVKTPQGFEDREVEVGMVNNTHASIVSGLKEGEELRLD